MRATGDYLSHGHAIAIPRCCTMQTVRHSLAIPLLRNTAGCWVAAGDHYLPGFLGSNRHDTPLLGPMTILVSAESNNLEALLVTGIFRRPTGCREG